MADCCNEIRAELAALRAQIANINRGETVDTSARSLAKQALAEAYRAQSQAGVALGKAYDVESQLAELKAVLATVAVLAAAGSAFAPIPKITVPVLIDSHIIVVLVTCANAKDTWYFGGLISQKINLGLTVGGLADSDGVQKNKLYLNRLTLLILPRLTSSYAVEVEVTQWFRQVSLIIWQYIGTESDTTEDLIQSVQSDLQRIESKIDAL